MNKTLLLILCDFLLLSLLALTRWEDARPAAPAPTAKPAATTPAAGSGPATPEQDMVAVMKLSLEDEQARRDEIARNLEQTEAARAAEERAKAALAADLEKKQNDLARAAQTAAALDRDLAASRAAALSERERAAGLSRDLAAREAELARANEAETKARGRAEELAVAVGVAAREKQILQEQTETLRAAVESERVERQRVQQAATELAAGVGQMAEKTGELAKEIRDAQPINANTLFRDFLARRLSARFVAERPGILGTISRTPASRTVVASDGKNLVALLHVDDTPFDWRAPAQADWTKIVLNLARGEGVTLDSVNIAKLDFLSIDPRLVSIPLSPEEAARVGGGTPYLLALDPFKFPEAVLISAGGAGYGELPFKLDPRNPGYVKVDNRLVRRLFGDFAPSRGDLVLSKTGELLGIMVNADTCALITNFVPQRTLALGENLQSTPTSPVLDAVAKRYQVLPLGLK